MTVRWVTTYAANYTCYSERPCLFQLTMPNIILHLLQPHEPVVDVSTINRVPVGPTCVPLKIFYTTYKKEIQTIRPRKSCIILKQENNKIIVTGFPKNFWRGYASTPINITSHHYFNMLMRDSETGELLANLHVLNGYMFIKPSLLIRWNVYWLKIEHMKD